MRVFFLLLPLLLSAAAQAKDLAQFPVLFHAGPKAGLEQDIRAGTVPADAWDRYILGSANFDVPDYRKGLYGAETLAGTSLYSLYDTLGGEEPWVMAVTIKPECLTPERRFGEEFTVDEARPQASRFSAWYLAHREAYKNLVADCLDPATKQKRYWEEGTPYNLAKADAETKRLTLRCTPVLSDFFRDQKIAVVSDPENDDSWYIRDRACIQSIAGSPDELLQKILGNQIGDPTDDFLRNFYGDSVEAGTYFAGNTFLLLAVLSEAPEISKNYLSTLDRIDLSLGAPTAPKALSFGSNADQPALFHEIAQGFSVAEKKGRVGTLQKRVGAFLKTVRASLAKACDGKHGVRKDREIPCQKASTAAAANLVKILRSI